MGGYMGTGPMTRFAAAPAPGDASMQPMLQRPTMPTQPMPGGAPLPPQPLRAGPPVMVKPPAQAPMPMQGATGPGTGAPGVVTTGGMPAAPLLRR